MKCRSRGRVWTFLSPLERLAIDSSGFIRGNTSLIKLFSELSAENESPRMLHAAVFAKIKERGALFKKNETDLRSRIAAKEIP